eukprot:Nk52_evm2s367 gene=Nk52_evmTU2s367
MEGQRSSHSYSSFPAHLDSSTTDNNNMNPDAQQRIHEGPWTGGDAQEEYRLALSKEGGPYYDEKSNHKGDGRYEDCVDVVLEQVEEEGKDKVALGVQDCPYSTNYKTHTDHEGIASQHYNNLTLPTGGACLDVANSTATVGCNTNVDRSPSRETSIRSHIFRRRNSDMLLGSKHFRKHSTQLKVWCFLKTADGLASTVYHGLLMLVIVLTLLLSFLSTIPDVNLDHFFILEIILTSWLVGEFAVKTYCSQCKSRFIGAEGLRVYLSQFTICVDVIITTTSLCGILLFIINGRDALQENAVAIKYIELVRLLRVERYVVWGGMISTIIYNSRRELYTCFYVGSLLLCITSITVYFLERDDQPDKFTSIPAALYWGYITLTTVGYGDIYPVTPEGKAVTTLGAIFGIAMFALPGGIIATSLALGVREHKREQVQEEKIRHASADLIQAAWRKYAISSDEFSNSVNFFLRIIRDTCEGDERLHESCQYRLEVYKLGPLPTSLLSISHRKQSVGSVIPVHVMEAIRLLAKYIFMSKLKNFSSCVCAEREKDMSDLFNHMVLARQWNTMTIKRNVRKAIHNLRKDIICSKKEIIASMSERTKGEAVRNVANNDSVHLSFGGSSPRRSSNVSLESVDRRLSNVEEKLDILIGSIAAMNADSGSGRISTIGNRNSNIPQGINETEHPPASQGTFDDVNDKENVHKDLARAPEMREQNVVMEPHGFQ